MRQLPQRPRRSAPIPVMLAVVCLVVLGGCAPKRVLRTTDPVPSPDESPGPTPPTSDPADKAVRLALAQRGRPYIYGGMNPEQGFDCSGLVFWAYGGAGVELPRVVSQQAHAGRSVPSGELAPGDLLFFATDGGDRTTHVGIYVGGQRFVHAPRTGDMVKVDSLNDAWWRSRWRHSRRIAGPP